MNGRQRVFVLCIVLLLAIVTIVTYQLTAPPPTSGKIRVVASFYPLAFFSEEIGGELVEVMSLIPDNTEVHSWQPSTSDILALSDADIIVYNGAGLDHWFEDEILPALNVTNKIVVETTANLALIPGPGGHGGEDHGQYDPHTWLSPYLAEEQAKRIYDALVSRDPAHASYYAQRWESLRLRFEGLDASYAAGLSNRTKGTIFVTHAAFEYLAERYNFTQKGVLGISADEQPSVAAMAGLVDDMMAYGTYVVFVDPVYSDQYAQTLKAELEDRTGHAVQVLDLYLALGPMGGRDYFGQMEANLDNLKIGLDAL